MLSAPFLARFQVLVPTTQAAGWEMLHPRDTGMALSESCHGDRDAHSSDPSHSATHLFDRVVWTRGSPGRNPFLDATTNPRITRQHSFSSFMSSPACADGYDMPAQQREDSTTFMSWWNTFGSGSA